MDMFRILRDFKVLVEQEGTKADAMVMMMVIMMIMTMMKTTMVAARDGAAV